MARDANHGGCEVIAVRASNATVEIAPEIGGALAAFYEIRDGQRVDWLRPTAPSALAEGNAAQLACFPLVPYSNRVRNGRFEFGGRRVQLATNPQTGPHFEHGHGWRNPWSVVARSDDAVILEYAHAPDDWPWRYRIRQSIRLAGGALQLGLEVTNEDTEDMPLGLGFHPYFPRPPGARLHAAVRSMWETDAEVLPASLVAPPFAADSNRGLDLDRVDLDNVFTGWQRRAVIDRPRQGLRLVMEAAAPLDFLVLYVPAGKDYFCAEPVSNATDAFNLAQAGRDDTGMLILAPGARAEAMVQITTKRLED